MIILLFCSALLLNFLIWTSELSYLELFSFVGRYPIVVHYGEAEAESSALPS